MKHKTLIGVVLALGMVSAVPGALPAHAETAATEPTTVPSGVDTPPHFAEAFADALDGGNVSTISLYFDHSSKARETWANAIAPFILAEMRLVEATNKTIGKEAGKTIQLGLPVVYLPDQWRVMAKLPWDIKDGLAVCKPGIYPTVPTVTLVRRQENWFYSAGDPDPNHNAADQQAFLDTCVRLEKSIEAVTKRVSAGKYKTADELAKALQDIGNKEGFAAKQEPTQHNPK